MRWSRLRKLEEAQHVNSILFGHIIADINALCEYLKIEGNFDEDGVTKSFEKKK